MLVLLLLILLPFSALGANLHSPDNPWGEYGAQCLTEEPSLWDESRIEQKWYTLDLDADAHVMWSEVAADFKDKMQSAIDVVKTMVGLFGGEGGWEAVLDLLKDAPDMLHEPYKTEIHALADLTGIQVEQLTLLNLFYEIAKACTSLVAMDHDGHTIHGRNQDFGFLFVWIKEEHTWDLTRRLRDLVVQLEFRRDGKELFKAVTFAGHLGILTAVKKGQFSLTINSRFGSSLDTITYFLEHGLEANQQFAVYADRDMFTNCNTFEEAKQYIESIQLLCGAYFIMGSTTGGMVVTRGREGADHESFIDTKQTNGWYVLQTNYDWDKADIYLDDRTIPGNKCMQKLGRKRVTKEGIFQVLSSKPNLNKATVYTSIMDIEKGELYTFKQQCEDPCWFV